jgi:hypothetical protein
VAVRDPAKRLGQISVQHPTGVSGACP